MTKVNLLKELKSFTEMSIRDLLLPVRMQKNDNNQPPPRAADVYMMRLVKSSDAQKAAPYIIHQVITGKDAQASGKLAEGSAVVRSIFCVYNEDEQEGALALLGLMERLRIDLLETTVIAKQYELVKDGDGLEMLIYPDDSRPYYAGEMIGTWSMPGVQRKVDLFNGL